MDGGGARTLDSFFQMKYRMQRRARLVIDRLLSIADKGERKEMADLSACVRFTFTREIEQIIRIRGFAWMTRIATFVKQVIP